MDYVDEGNLKILNGAYIDVIYLSESKPKSPPCLHTYRDRESFTHTALPFPISVDALLTNITKPRHLRVMYNHVTGLIKGISLFNPGTTVTVTTKDIA